MHEVILQASNDGDDDYNVTGRRKLMLT